MGLIWYEVGARQVGREYGFGIGRELGLTGIVSGLDVRSEREMRI